MMLISLLLALMMAQDNSEPRAVATNFLTAYLRQDKNVEDLERARSLRRFLSPRLIKVLDDAAACQTDWVRQQPKNSTDKPPFVDCCLFASNPDGIPTSFSLGPIQRENDGRYLVTINYEYKEGPGTYLDPAIKLQTYTWKDALLVVKTKDGYKIDDFLFLKNSKGKPPPRLSASFKECRGTRWVGMK
jgi:hypothetical protein